MRHGFCLIFAAGIVLAGSPPALSDDLGNSVAHHMKIPGVISKIDSGVIFVKTHNSIRTISPVRADRMGLYDAQKGEKVILFFDEGDVLIDVHKAGDPIQGHNLITGTLQYVDPFWEEVRVSNSEGTTQFGVDPLSGSKLSVFGKGDPVTLEIDEDNIMVDIRRGQ